MRRFCGTRMHRDARPRLSARTARGASCHSRSPSLVHLPRLVQVVVVAEVPAEKSQALVLLGWIRRPALQTQAAHQVERDTRVQAARVLQALRRPQKFQPRRVVQAVQAVHVHIPRFQRASAVTASMSTRRVASNFTACLARVLRQAAAGQDRVLQRAGEEQGRALRRAAALVVRARHAGTRQSQSASAGFMSEWTEMDALLSNARNARPAARPVNTNSRGVK